MTPTPNKTHPERTKRLHKSHYEDIICQGCQEVERAEVVHTRPWFSYVHECSKCGFINMESDWTEAHVLHLVLTQHWYDEHASGRKDVEYRAMSPHWKRLIWDRKHKLTHVRYSRGYSSTTMIRKIAEIDQGPCDIEGWGGMYYKIHHPEIKP
jgi:predicted transposase YbfD/YdcC